MIMPVSVNLSIVVQSLPSDVQILRTRLPSASQHLLAHPREPRVWLHAHYMRAQPEHCDHR
jgi:hypothetical protein